MKKLMIKLLAVACVCAVSLDVSAQSVLKEAKKKATSKPAAAAPAKPASTSTAKKTTTQSYPQTKDHTPSSLKKKETINVMGIPVDMILVEGGTFWMGNNDFENQKPGHDQKVSTFYMGKTEVTQELWEAVMGNNPSAHKGRKLPVENVNWTDCQIFISKLNKITGKYFRLPTEEEWEYAASGGKYFPIYDSGDRSWLADNSGNMTHEVATKLPNSDLGIHDMLGNVWEWTASRSCDNYNTPRNKNFTGPFVLRGNCFSDPIMLRNDQGTRTWQDIGAHMAHVGLRLAMSASPKIVIPNGIYYIQTADNPNLVLDNAACRVADGNNIQIWHKKPEDNKQWRVVNTGDGSIVIQVMQNNGYCVDHEAGVRADHSNVGLWPCYFMINQCWIPEKAGNNTYILKSKSDPDFLLTVSNNNIIPEANVEVLRNYGVSGQKWRFERIE